MVVIFGGEVRYLAMNDFSLRSFFLREKLYRSWRGRSAGRGIGRFLIQRCRQILLNFGIFAKVMFFTGDGKEKRSASKNDASASCEAHE
jgi:hypothetical protein